MSAQQGGCDAGTPNEPCLADLVPVLGMVPTWVVGVNSAGRWRRWGSGPGAGRSGRRIHSMLSGPTQRAVSQWFDFWSQGSVCVRARACVEFSFGRC